MNEPEVRPDDLRVSDAERARVQDRLRRAHDVGQLDLREFDDRVRTVWAARTRGELARVTADLPEPPPEPARPGVFAATPGGTAMRVLTTVWLGVLTVNLVIWGSFRSPSTSRSIPGGCWWRGRPVRYSPCCTRPGSVARVAEPTTQPGDPSADVSLPNPLPCPAGRNERLVP